jgi:large subunit ribosomal protein L21
VGQPGVENARVVATVLEQGLHPKVRVFKKKRRKQYRRTHGHRQPYTALRIDEIVAG